MIALLTQVDVSGREPYKDRRPLADSPFAVEASLLPSVITGMSQAAYEYKGHPG